MFEILQGDCREVMKALPDNSVDSVVTDPPYELNFMAKGWDRSGIAYDVSVWRECLRVLKPGGHLLAFGGSRTYHRLACAIEDAGLEVRDQIMWLYGQGFPKSLDISKAIDAAAGAERDVVATYTARGFSEVSPTNDGRNQWAAGEVVDKVGLRTAPTTDAAKQWNGWGTALKPAHEPIVLARKPLIGTVSENVLQHGTGGLNIDGCRIEHGSDVDLDAKQRQQHDNNWGGMARSIMGKEISMYKPDGRWPANVILSYPEDEYALRSNVTPEQKRELFKWLYENA